VTRLFNLATLVQRNSEPLVAFRAHSADPVVEANPPAVVTELQSYPDGALIDSHQVASFQVPPGTAVRGADPNIAFAPSGLLVSLMPNRA
jgi:hypothetical protein